MPIILQLNSIRNSVSDLLRISVQEFSRVGVVLFLIDFSNFLDHFIKLIYR